jgi:hypothetical protein
MTIRTPAPIFRYSGTLDDHLREHDGQPITSRTPLDPKLYDREEVGPMSRVTFADGVVADIFDDELDFGNGPRWR